MAIPKASITAGTGSNAVDSLLAASDHPHRAGVELLREAILGIDDRIQEEVKWNAPSFKLDDHFATFKLHPPKSIQLVLHTGSKPKSPPRRFVLQDDEHLVKWAAPDRCVVTVGSTELAKTQRQAVVQLVTQWIQQL